MPAAWWQWFAGSKPSKTRKIGKRATSTETLCNETQGWSSGTVLTSAIRVMRRRPPHRQRKWTLWVAGGQTEMASVLPLLLLLRMIEMHSRFSPQTQHTLITFRNRAHPCSIGPVTGMPLLCSAHRIRTVTIGSTETRFAIACARRAFREQKDQ